MEIVTAQPELTRPTQVTDMTDITVENLQVKVSFKTLLDERMIIPDP